jgi:hypothetical protein
LANRGISRQFHRFGLRTSRLVLDGSNGAVETPFHLTAQAEPTGTAVKGDLYFDSTANALMQYNGSAWEQVGASPSGNVVISGTLLYRRPVTSFTTASPTALTAADSGTQYNFNRAAGVAVVLPAVTASEVGVFYDFFFETTATGDHTITAQAADLLIGAVRIEDFDTANTGTMFAADGSDDLIITMNGTTKGGKKGSHLRLTCSSATSWTVQGNLFGDGTLATPFS